MATTNQERVGKALELLRAGLAPFIEREFSSHFGPNAQTRAEGILPQDRDATRPMAEWDAHLLLKLMWEGWNMVFRDTLGQAERNLVSELRQVRNRWAHQEAFSTDDTYRAIDSGGRLLAAVSAPEAAELDRMKNELLRIRFEAETKHEKKKLASTPIQTEATHNLKPWREVVQPHADVATGRYQQAEFAADLWQVHIGEGAEEYRDPREFFRRTYLTESLQALLRSGIERLTGTGGDPVIQLQTNFGGGKTHSMLALYHLFGGTRLSELAGVESLARELEVSSLPTARRVVIVGNKISPGNPSRKPDGTVVRTLWGELAWQLGGAEAYARIREDDEKATSPGDALRELFVEHGPCLILIDEWVAYARQLHDAADLPGGSFETHFTFAQTLTEAAKAAPRTLVVVSLPASDTGASPHTLADSVEVGGERGRAALERLRNAIGRLEASWRPATAEEGFEIVRRRLFEPLTDPDQFVARDTVARAYFDFYRTHRSELPPEIREAEYERRLQAAYPIHPELFDRLYTDWATQPKFQRTRGVLRLMAAVISSLWDKNDRSPLIHPANVPIDDPRVQSELTRYLSDNWQPIIEKDVDGPNSLPLQMDRDVPNLGKHSAFRRVARTIYIGSAPIAKAANKGLDDRRVRLGCMMPGEAPATFGDALRRLSGKATYLYSDGGRYWYSTQPTVTKVAEDRAEQFRRDADKIHREMDRRLRKDLADKGDFYGVHPLPTSGQDVPDQMEARLVVLGPEAFWSNDGSSLAEKVAVSILESRGSAPRRFRNALVFLVPERQRLEEFEEAVSKYLAWESVVTDAEELDLTAGQKTQAETERRKADAAVELRLYETWRRLLVPEQPEATKPVTMTVVNLSGTEPLAVRAAKRMRTDESLVTHMNGTYLRGRIDKIPLWRGDHVSVRQLAEDFASYTYLPRLRSTDALLRAVADGLQHMTWREDSFAFADSFDEEVGRYRGLRAGQVPNSMEGILAGVLVRPDAAMAQMERERPESVVPPTTSEGRNGGGSDPAPAGGLVAPPAAAPVERKVTRFHGSVEIDPIRASSDAGRIAEEVVSHLAGLVGARVRVTLEIEADVPSGVPSNVVRIVTENARTLKFGSQGFEEG